ncbi:MAG: ABC transporter ATP-binding protein [Clostridia bacterium]
MSIFKMENVGYSYDGKKYVIQNCNLSFEKGKVYAIIGKSGAGKTTLLSMLSGLTRPTKGEIRYNDKDIKKINQYAYRSKYVGVIFQSYNLIPYLTAAENVVLSMDISGKKIGEKKTKAQTLLSDVGIRDEMTNRRILKLSGGEQQRVAIARTLAYEPDVILADEPTGNLDGETQSNIMDIFLNLAHEQEKCIIIVTHSPEVAKKADVCYSLSKL